MTGRSPPGGGSPGEQTDHYFSSSPKSRHEERSWEEILCGRRFVFTSDAGVFSRRGVDRGSRLLIETVSFSWKGPICDLGCGYGPIGIVAAALRPQVRVHLTDVNPRAAQLARRNVAANGLRNARVWCGDGLSAVEEPFFDQVLMNPPIRAGKAVIERLVAEATSRLSPTGELWLVVRTAHGAKSLQRWLQERFGPVEEAAKGSGYRVFRLRPDFGAPGTISPGGAWEGGPGADTK